MRSLEHHVEKIGGESRVFETRRLAQTYYALVLALLVLLYIHFRTNARNVILIELGSVRYSSLAASYWSVTPKESSLGWLSDVSRVAVTWSSSQALRQRKRAAAQIVV